MQKVSVITVVFNNIDNIERTIKNVLKQTYQNLEYIVVDGASTDGTTEVVKKYDGQIKWISEPDKGIYDAMMKGTRMATGEWIIFHNSGDYFFTPSVIEDIMSWYEDKGEDFIIANSRFFNSWGYKDNKPIILEKSYYFGMPVHHPSTFIRRSTQLKYPFHLEYRNSADYCFFVEALRDGATYKYFDLILSYINFGEGATADHYDVSLSENIDFFSRLGVDSLYIKELENNYKRFIIKNRITRFIPFYGLYIKYMAINKGGWKRCDISKLLSNV